MHSKPSGTGVGAENTVQPIQSPESSSPNPVSRTARSGSGTGRSRNHPAGGRGTEPNCNHPAPEISFSNVKEGLHEEEKLQSGGSHSTMSSKRRRGVQNSACPKSGFVQRDNNHSLVHKAVRMPRVIRPGVMHSVMRRPSYPTFNLSPSLGLSNGPHF